MLVQPGAGFFVLPLHHEISAPLFYSFCLSAANTPLKAQTDTSTLLAPVTVVYSEDPAIAIIKDAMRALRLRVADRRISRYMLRGKKAGRSYDLNNCPLFISIIPSRTKRLRRSRTTRLFGQILATVFRHRHNMILKQTLTLRTV